MNYSILIELSRHTIAFSYSRDDGKNQFIPYGDELVKPLAIYSSGNELRIGRFAAEEAHAGRLGAFDNIFDAIKKPASFTYRGTQYPLNKLLLFGIEQCLREFFDSILYGTEGQLEQNTAKVPICFLMSSELTDNEQAYVINLLRNAGYINTISRDYNSMVLNYVRTSLTNNIEKAVFVSNTGNDLYIQCVDGQSKRIFDLSAKDAGMNPQIDQVIKLIWQEILYDENSINLVFDECLPELQNHAQSFLASGDLMCQNLVTFKGHSYEYYITKCSLSNGMRGNDNALGNLLLQLKSKGVDPTKSAVILLKSTAKNTYVKRSFCDFFPTVVIFDEKKHQEMLNTILKVVQERNYILSDFAPKTIQSSGDVINSPMAPVHTGIAIQTDNKSFNREWREVKGTARGLMRNGKPDEAIEVLERFINKFDNKGLDLSEAILLLEDVKRYLKESSHDVLIYSVTSAPPKGPVVSAPSTNEVNKFKREWRIVRAEAKGFLREDKAERAREILERFIREHQGWDIDEPMQMLHELRGTPSVINENQANTSKSSKHEMESKHKVVSEGERLMKELKFSEAKAWFADNGFTSMASDCATLIKAVRYLRAYKAEITSIKNNHNIQLAKSHLDDMIRWRAIYTRYGLDTKEIDDIIISYKSIK